MIETYKLAHELYDTSNNFMKFKSNNARGRNLRGHIYDRERKNQKGRTEILIQMSSNKSMEQPPQLCC